MQDKILVLIESPGKLKSISKYLGDGYVVKATVGHVKDLLSGGSSGIGVDLKNDFKPRYAIIPDKKNVVQDIINAAKNSKEIWCATDADREGHGIALHLSEILEFINIPIKRVIFHEITKKGIENGIKDLQDLDLNMAEAQQSRRVLDRVVGFTISSFIIKQLGPSLSAGRVQSPAIRLVVDRERAIENFKPDEYWNIQTTLASITAPEGIFQAKLDKKITESKIALKIKQELENDSFVISKLEEKEKKRNPLPPLITSSLVISAAGRYKFNAQKTMKAAQSLYESGKITYMRTDSVKMSDDAISECRSWLKTNNYAIPNKTNIYLNSDASQNAHESCRPTQFDQLPANLIALDDEKKIYRLIWERAVASQMEAAVFDTVSLVVKSSSDHILKANGRVLKSKGWLEISKDFESDEDDSENKLPNLKLGEKLILVPPQVTANQKFTQPPPRYSEKTLIKQLESQKIGRPSTFASITNKITDKNYLTKKGDMYVATDLGKRVVDLLVANFDFINFDYTAKMEDQLDLIASGKLDYLTMMREFYTPFAEQVKTAYKSSQKNYGFKCDKCQGIMRLKQGSFGAFLACENFDATPSCKFTFSVELVEGLPVRKDVGSFIPIVINDVNCPKCKGKMILRKGKYGDFYACLRYPNCNGTAKVPFEGKNCPECHDHLSVVNFGDRSKLACMSWPKCEFSEDLPISSSKESEIS